MMNKTIESFNGKLNINVKKLLSVFWALLVLFRIPRVFGIGILYTTSYVTRAIGNFGVTYERCKVLCAYIRIPRCDPSIWKCGVGKAIDLPQPTSSQAAITEAG